MNIGNHFNLCTTAKTVKGFRVFPLCFAMEIDWNYLVRELKPWEGETIEAMGRIAEMALRRNARDNWRAKNSERRTTKKWECNVVV